MTPDEGGSPLRRRPYLAGRVVLLLLPFLLSLLSAPERSEGFETSAQQGRPGEGEAHPGRPALDRFDVVVLDAGHGGHDEGATGPSGLHEKDLVLDVTKRLAERLRRHGVRVVLTRSSDEFLSLERRTAVANDARADLFLSIHANASPSREPHGVETYFASLDATDDAARATAERENEAFGPSV